MKFWQELRRRRVFRLAGLYIVGAWLAVQVADIVLPAWAVPETAMRYLIIAATLCFPIALVFAWFYDITAGGIVRTPPAGESEAVVARLKRSDYAILAALLFIAGTILVGSIERIVHTSDDTLDAAAPDERPENSLAVLPFENLDPNPDTEYFSNGISEEILHKLSSVRALKVLGRTSSFAFGSSDQGPKRISEILGVRYLLSGTVRREANQVRITARLLDDAGFQVWSASFDGALESIFDLQSRIATEVASQITSELVESAGGGSKTDNMEAYRYYLVGNEYFNKRPPNWGKKAEEAFRIAIAADPDFAPAYVGLANSLAIGRGARGIFARLDDADAALETALRLDPDLAGAYATRGVTRTGPSPMEDSEAAVRDLEHAVQLDPNQAMAWSWLANAYFALDRVDEALAAQDRGLAIDPFNVPLVLNTSDRFSMADDNDGAIQHISRLLLLPEPPGAVYRVLSGLHEAKSDYPAAIDWTKKAIRQFGADDSFDTGQLSYLYDLLGMQDNGDYWFARHEESNSDPLSLLFRQVERYIAIGEIETAITYLERYDAREGFDLADYPPEYPLEFAKFSIALGHADSGLEQLEQDLGEDGSEINTEDDVVEAILTLFLLADGYEQLGEHERATAIRTRATNIAEQSLGDGESASDPQVLFAQAFVYGTNGRAVEGAAALNAAIDNGFDRYLEVTADPILSKAFTAPEFASAVKRLETLIAEHRKVVEAQDKIDDFRTEFERMLEESAN